MKCAYCGHDQDEHDGGTEGFPTGCMHTGSPGGDYGDAENCDGHCLCPEFEVAASGDPRERH